MEISHQELKTRLALDLKAAEERVTAALKEEGFGVLTEIDVQATFKRKLDVGFRPYKILGACNPKLAHRALTAKPDVGLLLPCNVTLTQYDDQSTEVAAIAPLTMMQMLNEPELEIVAAEAHERLARVIASLHN